MAKAVLAFFLAVAAALPGAAPALAQQFPPLSGRVVDAANIIPSDVESRLTARLEQLETQSQRQLVVATIPDLQGYDIADYGYRLGREWGIGDKDRNDGALLIVAPNDRKVRIEVGYGLEPVLTDGFSFLIVNDTILPKFKQGDMAGGIEAGTDAIVNQLLLPADEARKVAEQAAQSQREDEKMDHIVSMIFIFIFIAFFVLPMFLGNRGVRRSGYGGGPVIWSGGGGRGSSWGSGGGFSGGGGSFGGGGASGSW